MPTICLVSCVHTKRAEPAEARDLYTSPLFTKMRAFAERHADRWYVLSARYGLLAPAQVVAPYQMTLHHLAPAQRVAWAAAVLRDLRQVLAPGDHVVVLASEVYRRHLVEGLCRLGCTVEIPMQGLGIGRQLHWLDVALAECGPRAAPDRR